MRVWVAIWTGSSVISRGIAGWIAGGPAPRLVLVLVIAGFIKGLPATTGITMLFTAAWIGTAIVLGLRLPASTEEEGDGESDEEEAPAAPGGITREQLVQALHAVGAPHAHTTALAEHLGASTEAVREALAAAGIPTSGGVRMKGRKVAVSPGVKAADFPPLPSSTEATTQEGALTSNNNDNNNGSAFMTVPDEERPHRTLVHWLKAAK